MEFYDTSQIDTNLIKRSFSAGITRIMPNGNAPLFALSGMAKKKAALQTEHGYWTKTMIFPSLTLNGSIDNSQTNLIVDSTLNVVVGSVLQNQTVYSAGVHSALAEVMLVTAIVDATNLTVVRGFGGSTAIAGVDNKVFPIIGTAHPQGSVAPLAVAVAPVRTLNNTQIFRNTWALSGTVVSIQEEVGDGQKAENRSDCAAFHAQDIEKSTLFGKKGSTTLGGRPLTSMDGIESMIYQKAPNNLHDANTTTNYTQLETMLNPGFDYSTDAKQGNVRTLFCGGLAVQVINEIGRLSGSYQIVDGQTSFGLKFSTFKTSRGRFNIIEHPILNTQADWKKMAISLDLSQFDFAYLTGRDTFHTAINSKNQATNGADEEAGVLTSELTIEMRNPAACGIIYNLTAAA